MRTYTSCFLFLLFIAVFCFISTIIVGLLMGWVTAFPQQLYETLSFRLLRPLHIFLTMAWLFFGLSAAVGLYCDGSKKINLRLAQVQCVSYMIYFIGALIGIMRGEVSGREYLPWPPLLSIPLLIAFLATLLNASYSWKKLQDHSGDAAWLVMLGLVLLPLGLIENYLYLIRNIAVDVGRDLTIQWHALDTVIVAWCVVLYGMGILLLPPGRKGPRATWLFILATIGILLDFGHHNYISPQPHYIKIISFCATMLAIISFLRHLHAYRKSRIEETSVTRLLNQAEAWTLFAVGTGILMAVPHINYYTHGTYAVVGHTMGSIIGVNSFLLFAIGFYHVGTDSKLRQMVIRFAGYLLALFCLALIGLGITRGILRAEEDFLFWNPKILPWLKLIPYLAIPLSLALLYLGIDLCRGCIILIRQEQKHDSNSKIVNV